MVAAIAAAWLAFGTRAISGAWLATAIAAFVVLAVLHDRVIRRRERAERAATWYEAGLARIEDRWMGGGDSGERFRPDDHAYADDLDLFGEGSLFELLGTTRTPAGAARLASWLLAPASPDEVRARQSAVEELRPRTELREDLALLGESVAPRLSPEALVRWGEEAPLGVPAALRPTLGALALATSAALGAWLVFGVTPYLFGAGLALQIAAALALRRRAGGVLRRADGPTRDLALLAQLLERLERERFSAPRLVALRAQLQTQGAPPSRRVAQLRRLVDLADARRNQLFVPLALLWMWGTQLALAIESWRATCGPQLASWIDAAGEIEAICALSTYAFEHAQDPFPEFVDAQGGAPLLEGEALGHPLLPAERCVRNDLRLDGDCQALVVSGSNMSGKSTFLRTAGVNAVLAQAGAPVRAARLRMSPLAVGASIRVTDSLQDGTSHFYAEILQLRAVVELASAGDAPLLFLLDEILHGTNSHDRRIGAEAVVRGLLERGAIGMVTTHDLALADVADALAPRMRNVHFEDRLEDGRVVFDYALREGVVTRSNALELMRSVGLEV